MFKKIFANLLDQMIVFGVSVVVFFLAQLILKVIGFKMSQPQVFLIIFYGIINVLYYPILGSLGNRILKLND